jgi:hypothetical protein
MAQSGAFAATASLIESCFAPASSTSDRRMIPQPPDVHKSGRRLPPNGLLLPAMQMSRVTA